LKYFSHNST